MDEFILFDDLEATINSIEKDYEIKFDELRNL
jgi:hypothetical protein